MSSPVGFDRALKLAFIEHGDTMQRMFIHFDVIDSTSSELARRMDSGPVQSTIVTAGMQTAGRGRRGRSWYSPLGCLYLSTSIQIGTSRNESIHLLPLAAGLAAATAIDQYFAATPTIKWPNDLLISGRKTAGILCEVPKPKAQPDLVIVGIGVNIGEIQLPTALQSTATSLPCPDDSNGATRIKSNLAARFVLSLESWMHRVESGDGSVLIEMWKDHAEPFGRRVRVDGLAGTTQDLDEQGRLIVVKSNGQTERVAGGIVEVL